MLVYRRQRTCQRESEPRIALDEEQRLYYVALTRAKARLYLPLVPDKLGGKRWDGGYRRLNERLTAVATNLEGSGHRDRFRIVTVSGSSSRNRRGTTTDSDRTIWQRGGARTSSRN